jgi:F-type H+-transporting ATPase subunit epsilon
MRPPLRLKVTTPSALLVEDSDVISLRAEDESGGFGVLPGHADFLTALPACVLRWRRSDGKERYCAVRGGVITVKGGGEVNVACRHGVLGDDLARLEGEVRAAATARASAASHARVEQTRLHAYAVRQLVRYLRPAGLPESVLTDGEGDAQ